MYDIGEFVIYGTDGVCRVEKIGASKLPEMSAEKKYYTLCPVYEKGCEIVTPVDQDRIVMRRVLEKQEVMDLIDRMGELPEIWVREEKKREEDYKEVIRSCDCERLLSMIKTLYRRKQMRLAAGKKVTAKDMKYFNMAETNLYGEFAVALDLTPAKVKERIISQMKEKEQNQKASEEMENVRS
ncbi:MAG: CarD family transcriptional regulator [Lachnospiraceae bacterium]|nr:CarD family transcriptional regulator [Lachnospiraceae bacterium]